MFDSFALCALVASLAPMPTHAGALCGVACQAAAVADAAKQNAPAAEPVTPAKPKIELVSVETAIVDRTNAERSRYGLPPLEVDESLMESARAHAQWMTRNQTMRHTSAAVAENIAMGQQDSQQAMSSWMGSSGHRANILNPSNHRIGVAAFQTASGVIFWCQQFRP
jgi:uncharacterized protein YkwD